MQKWRKARAIQVIEFRDPIPNWCDCVGDEQFPVEKLMTTGGERFAYPHLDVVVRINGATGVRSKKHFKRNYEVIE